LPNKRKIFIITISNNKKKLHYFKKKKIKVIKLNKLDDKNDFKVLFKKLFKIGFGRILIESGLIFLNKLFKFKFINNLYIFKSNINLYNNGSNKINSNFIKKLEFKKKIKVNLGTDLLFETRVK